VIARDTRSDAMPDPPAPPARPAPPAPLNRPAAPDPIVARKRAELAAKLQALPAELDIWRGLSADETSPLAKHHTQIRRLAAQVEGLQSQIETDIGALVTDDDLLRQARTMEKRLLAVQAVWEFFRSKLVLRAQEPFAAFLKSSDAFAWACYAPMLQRYGDAQGTRREPPLVALQGDWSPFAIPRDRAYQVMRSPGGWTDSAPFVDVISSLPVPIVGVPWLHLEHLPNVLIIAHEVGHIVEHDFGLETTVGDRIADALKEANITDTAHTDAWKHWRAEAFADLFACYTAGQEFVWTLVDLLARRAQDITSETLDDEKGWGDYPTTTLRVLLNVAALELLGHADHATRIRTEWTKSYASHAMSAFEPDLPVVAKAIVSSVGNNGLLPADLAFTGVAQQAARAVNRLRQNLPLSQDATLQDPRAIVAAASSIYRQQPTADHRDRWLRARQHIVNVRPPGLLADEEQKSADQIDEAQDRQAGNARASAFFAALEKDG
jgi:hypothetical protein